MRLKVSKLRQFIREATRTYEVDPHGGGTIYVDEVTQLIVEKMRAVGHSLDYIDDDGNYYKEAPPNAGDWILTWSYHDAGPGQHGIWQVGQATGKQDHYERAEAKFLSGIDWESSYPEMIHLTDHVASARIWWKIPEEIVEEAFRTLEDRLVASGQIDWRPEGKIPEDDY